MSLKRESRRFRQKLMASTSLIAGQAVVLALDDVEEIQTIIDGRQRHRHGGYSGSLHGGYSGSLHCLGKHFTSRL